jgi:hypothetical protein
MKLACMDIVLSYNDFIYNNVSYRIEVSCFSFTRVPTNEWVVTRIKPTDGRKRELCPVLHSDKWNSIDNAFMEEWLPLDI